MSPNLQTWFEATAELLGSLSDREQATIGTGNARRIYRLN
jgi:predicted TIM-barrel fold metal-dependent hydrolase